jgi:hypothetical protein
MIFDAEFVKLTTQLRSAQKASQGIHGEVALGA